MTEKELIRRLLRSRHVMQKYRHYPGRQWAGGVENELAILETEIGILLTYQQEFPHRHAHIEGIITGWRDAQAKLRAKMH